MVYGRESGTAIVNLIGTITCKTRVRHSWDGCSRSYGEEDEGLVATVLIHRMG